MGNNRITAFHAVFPFFKSSSAHNHNPTNTWLSELDKAKPGRKPPSLPLFLLPLCSKALLRKHYPIAVFCPQTPFNTHPPKIHTSCYHILVSIPLAQILRVPSKELSDRPYQLLKLLGKIKTCFAELHETRVPDSMEILSPIRWAPPQDCVACTVCTTTALPRESETCFSSLKKIYIMFQLHYYNLALVLHKFLLLTL